MEDNLHVSIPQLSADEEAEIKQELADPASLASAIKTSIQQLLILNEKTYMLHRGKAKRLEWTDFAPFVAPFRQEDGE